jgi:hypothetical protein
MGKLFAGFTVKSQADGCATNEFQHRTWCESIEIHPRNNHVFAQIARIDPEVAHLAKILGKLEIYWQVSSKQPNL